MKKTIGIGIIGWGFMGKTHTYAHRNLPLYFNELPFETKLVGLCSRTIEKAQIAAREMGFSFATDSIDELLAREDIDAVHVCTPNENHCSTILKALSAHKHVYCDKPLAISAAQAEEVLLARAAQKNLTCAVALQWRYSAPILRAKQFIDEGRIGRVTQFYATYHHSGSVDAAKPISWKQDKSICGGGVLFDLGAHALDLVYHLIGEVEALSCRTRILHKQRPLKDGTMVDIQADDAAMLLLQMKDGSLGTVDVSKIATGTNDELSIAIYGEKGAIKADLMNPNYLYFFDNALREAPYGGERGFKAIECVQRYDAPSSHFPSVKSTAGWLRPHVQSVYAFLNDIYSGNEGAPSFAEGAYIQRVMDCAYRSDAENRWVALCDPIRTKN